MFIELALFVELKRIELSHKPCKGPSPALEHATPYSSLTIPFKFCEPKQPKLENEAWAGIQNWTEIVGLQSRNNNHYTIPTFY